MREGGRDRGKKEGNPGVKIKSLRFLSHSFANDRAALSNKVNLYLCKIRDLTIRRDSKLHPTLSLKFLAFFSYL